MIVVPVIERELRVSARKPATYTYRLLSVGVAVCVGGFIILMSSLQPTGSHDGRTFFHVLSSLLLVLCLFEGARSTAECISEERRQGTLGLLFLTDLCGVDVVLGKLAALGLRPLYSLLAVFPILSLAIPMGGVSGAELWRMGLVLVSNLLFSLCLGLAVSAITPSGRSAFFWVISSLLVIVGGPIAVGGALDFANIAPWDQNAYALSPLFSFAKCDDTGYRLGPARFWLSVSAGFMWAACGVAIASWGTPRKLYETTEKREPGFLFRPVSALLPTKPVSGKAVSSARQWKPIGDNENPACRLFTRPSVGRGLLLGTGSIVLLFAGLVGCMLIWDWPVEMSGGIGFAIATVLGIGTRIGLASQVAHDAAAIGNEKFWETVATTPLTQAKILSGLLRTTLRLWIVPVAAQIILSLASWILLFVVRESQMEPWPLILGPGQVGMFLVDLVTIGAFSAASALTTGKPGAAAVRAIVYTQVLPSIFCCWGALRLISDQAFLVFSLTRLFSDWRVLFEKRPR